MPQIEPEIVVYARVGLHTAERHVCHTFEEAREAIDEAIKEGTDLAEMVENEDLMEVFV